MPYVIVADKIGEFDRRALQGSLKVGRSPECGVSVKDNLLSRKHCLIEEVDGQWVATDLGSKNGTYINSQRIGERQVLQDGQTLRVGRTRVTFFAAYISEAPPPPPKRERPADPVEALAGTVAGFEYQPPVEIDDEIADRPQPERTAAAMKQETPSPKPKPRAKPAPDAKQNQEQAYELLSATSNSWESVYQDAKQTMGLETVLEEPNWPRPRPTSPVDMTIHSSVRSGRAWRGLRITVKRAWAKVTRLTGTGSKRALVPTSSATSQR